MTGARHGAALLCAAGLWFGINTAQAAPDTPKDEAKDDVKASCLAAPKGIAPSGEKWFYRVERGTKRHCWYTRAAGTRRVAESAPASAPRVPAPKVAEPLPPDVPIQLDHSVANARAEAGISGTAAIAPSQAPQEAPPPNWQMAQRWSDHQNGGAPFESKPAAAPAPIAPPPETTRSSNEPEDTSTQRLLEIAGGAFGFAALATVLVMIFARRQQRREAATGFALFATMNDPKRKLNARPVEHAPPPPVRPKLVRAEDATPLHATEETDEVSMQPEMETESEPPMRPFTPRNMRMDRA